jgi:Outer membrane protein beta-barrel domain
MDEPLHNHPDKLFRDSIESLSEAPGKRVWGNIEQQLDKAMAEKYKRKYIMFRRMALSFLVLLLSFVTFNVIRLHETKIAMKPANIPVKKEQVFELAKSSFLQEKHYGRAVPPGEKPYATERHGHRSAYPVQQIMALRTAAVQQKPNYRYDERVTDIPREAVALRIMDIEPPVPDVISPLSSAAPAIRLIDPSVTRRSLVAGHTIIHPGLKQQRIHQFYISGFFAPEYANYVLENDEASNYENKQVIQKREEHLFSYSTGLSLSYRLNKKVRLQSGFSWSSSNININPDKIYAVKDNSGEVKYRYNTSSGYGYILPSFSTYPIIGDSLYTRTSVHTLQFISIPVMAQYKFLDRRLVLEAGLGISFNFLTKAALKTEVNDDTESEVEFLTRLNGLRKLSYSILINGELQYKASEKWSVVAGPYLKYALTSVNAASIVKTYPYSLGLSLGMMYKL